MRGWFPRVGFDLSLEPGPGYIKRGRGGLARFALSEDWLHKGIVRAKQVNALLNALIDSHPCIVEVGARRPHFLTFFVIDGCVPWKHLALGRGVTDGPGQCQHRPKREFLTDNAVVSAAKLT